MVETNKVVEFLNTVREKKVESLMGLALDMHYYDEKIKSFGNEDDLRDKLSDEQEKAVKDGTGRIVKDERDMEVVNKLNGEITKLANLKAKKLEAEEVKKDIGFYIELLNKLKEDLLGNKEFDVSKALNELAKL